MTGLVIQLNILGMTGRRKASTPSQYRKEFAERVKAARVLSTKTQGEIADELGVKLNTYQTWETRALLPHQHIVPFCRATGTDIFQLLTGIPFDLGQALVSKRSRAA